MSHSGKAGTYKLARHREGATWRWGWVVGAAVDAQHPLLGQHTGRRTITIIIITIIAIIVVVNIIIVVNVDNAIVLVVGIVVVAVA